MQPSHPPVLLRRLVAISSLLLLVATACSSNSTVVAGESTDDPPAEPTVEAPAADEAALAALRDARTLWESQGIDTYEYTYTRACECSEAEFGPNTVKVVDGAVTEVVDADGNPVDATALTVDELFARSEESILQGEPNANEYQSELGYPFRVSLDTEAQQTDGGFALGIIGFSQNATAEADLAAARDLWETAQPQSYTMTYRLVCFCPELRATVVVEDGAVTSFENLSEGDISIDELTVEDLFADLQAAFDADAANVTATYDPDLGYPMDYYVDEDEMMADEEHGYTVESFELL